MAGYGTPPELTGTASRVRCVPSSAFAEKKERYRLAFTDGTRSFSNKDNNGRFRENLGALELALSDAAAQQN
jgi:hypothetical protein